MALRLKRALVLAGTVALSTGCTSNEPFEQQASVMLTVDLPSLGAGQEATFAFEAVGTAMIGVVLDYGDATVDSISFFGATEASGSRKHTFGAAGTFTVLAILEDALVGGDADTVTVTVTP